MSFLKAFFGSAIALLSTTEILDIPFKAGVNGTVVVSNISVVRETPYDFFLDLYFDETNQADRSLISKMAGKPFGLPDHRLDNGLAIPVSLSIDRVEEGNTVRVFQQDIHEEEMAGFSSNFFSKKLVQIRLSRGNYIVTLKSNKDIPDLLGIKVHFSIRSGIRK